MYGKKNKCGPLQLQLLECASGGEPGDDDATTPGSTETFVYFV